MIWALILESILAQSERDVLVRRVEHVRFFSEIDRDSVDRLERIIRPGDVVQLNGPGGDFDQSVRLAEILRMSDASVEVEGQCISGCALAWVTAPHRRTEGFDAVFFHGSPLTALTFARAHPNWVTDSELQAAERNSNKMAALLSEAGVAPWLFHCAVRLQQGQHELISDLSTDQKQRIRSEYKYSLIWFPRSELESAGVKAIEYYESPSDLQKERAENSYGPYGGAVRIYWAMDNDCAPERQAAEAN